MDRLERRKLMLDSSRRDLESSPRFGVEVAAPHVIDANSRFDRERALGRSCLVHLG
jgi:hypothetical protein